MRRVHLKIGLGVGFIILMVSSDSALAAETSQRSLDTIVDIYKTSTSQWQSVLKGYALTLFWLLVAIEFTYAAIRLVFRGADFSEWLGELLNQILFIGFFLTLLTNSSDWAQAVVTSFRHAADQASGKAGISPSTVFDTGLSLAQKVGANIDLWSLGSTIGLWISAIVIVICFALIAAYLVLALVESYIVISAGVLFMGFGGARWTKDYALKIAIYALSIGAKLFIMQLIIGLGQQVFNTLLANFEAKTTDIYIVLGSAIVLLALVKIIPEIVQGLISGASVGHGSALVGAATSVVGGVAASTLGAGMVVKSASQLASEQMTDEGSSGLGRRATHMAKNIAHAAVHNVGDRLSGRYVSGTRLGQMSSDMNCRANERREKRKEKKSTEQTNPPADQASAPSTPSDKN